MDAPNQKQDADFSVINVICDGIAPSNKAVFLKSKSGNRACFPLSQIELVTGEFEKGHEITVKVPKWLLDAARATSAGNTQDIRFTAKVLVTGVRLDASAKAVQLRCDADMVSRWFAYSKVEIDGGEIPPHSAPVRLICPAWMLRTKQGHFPSWTAGAIIHE